MNFLVWIGRKGFMRGPIWSILLLISWIILVGHIHGISTGKSSNPATAVIYLIISAIYIVLYYFLPKFLKK